MPGEDRAAEVLALGGDRLEGGGGAEVDDDRRAAEEVEGRHRVGDAVGADLLGVVVEDRQPGAHARLDDQGREPEVALGHAAQRPGDPGHRRADGDAVDVVVLPGEPVEAEELLEHEGVLVGGALDVGGDAPVVDQARVGQAPLDVGVDRLELVEPDHGLGVADVEGEEHGVRRYEGSGRGVEPVAGVSGCRGRCRGRGPTG